MLRAGRCLLQRSIPWINRQCTRLYATASTETLYPINLRFLYPRDLLVDLYVGTPPQKFTLLLDTGSKHLWIRHKKLLQFARGNTFLPSKSSTWQQSKLQWGVKYIDNTVVEGVEGIETVRLGDVEADMRVGVAEKIYREGEKGSIGKILGAKAGHPGYEGLDGILGMGTGSSFVDGLRGAGVNAIKLSFEPKNSKIEIVKNVEGEKDGIVWYDVQQPRDKNSWEIILKKVTYKGASFSLPRKQRMMIDTGSPHHYLPSRTAESLFSHPSLENAFTQVHFVISHEEASPDTDSGFLQTKAYSDEDEPVYLEFAGSSIKWPIKLTPPFDDNYASIRGSIENRALLGMSFLATLKGIIFDFTKGKERIGFVTDREIPASHGVYEGNREHVLQFLVGSSLALILVGGYRYYYNEAEESKD